MRILITLFLFSYSILAEDLQEKSWIDRPLTDFGTFYFGFSNEMGTLHEQECNFWGFDLGALVSPNDSSSFAFILGLGGTWLDNSITADFQSTDREYSYPVHMKIGGPRLGVLFMKDKMFQPSFDFLVGAGDIQYQMPAKKFDLHKDALIEQKDAVLVVMPKVNLEIKIAKCLKFGWGFSYRYIHGVDVPWSSSDEASAFGYHGVFKVGNFSKS